jgi:hypothetical protein
LQTCPRYHPHLRSFCTSLDLHGQRSRLRAPDHWHGCLHGMRFRMRAQAQIMLCCDSSAVGHAQAVLQHRKNCQALLCLCVACDDDLCMLQTLSLCAARQLLTSHDAQDTIAPVGAVGGSGPGAAGTFGGAGSVGAVGPPLVGGELVSGGDGVAGGVVGVAPGDPEASIGFMGLPSTPAAGPETQMAWATTCALRLAGRYLAPAKFWTQTVLLSLIIPGSTRPNPASGFTRSQPAHMPESSRVDRCKA